MEIVYSAMARLRMCAILYKKQTFATVIYMQFSDFMMRKQLIFENWQKYIFKRYEIHAMW